MGLITRSTTTPPVTFVLHPKRGRQTVVLSSSSYSPRRHRPIINCCYNNNNNNKETTTMMIKKDYYLQRISPSFAQKIHSELSLSAGAGGDQGSISEIDTSRYYLAHVSTVSEDGQILSFMKSYCVGQIACGMACAAIYLLVGFYAQYKQAKHLRDREARNNIRKFKRANSEEDKLTTP